MEKIKKKKDPNVKKQPGIVKELLFKISRDELVVLAKNGDLRAQYIAISEFNNYMQKHLPKDIAEPIIAYMHDLLNQHFTKRISFIDLLPVLARRNFNRIEKEWYTLLSGAYSASELEFLKRGKYVPKRKVSEKALREKNIEVTSRKYRVDMVLMFSCDNPKSRRKPLKNEKQLLNLINVTFPKLLKEWEHIFHYVEV